MHDLLRADDGISMPKWLPVLREMLLGQLLEDEAAVLQVLLPAARETVDVAVGKDAW